MALIASLALLPSFVLGGIIVPRAGNGGEYQPNPTPTYAGTCTFYASESIWNALLPFATATTYSTTCTQAPSAGPYVTANCVEEKGPFGFGTITACGTPAAYTSCTTSLVGWDTLSVCTTPTFAASPVPAITTSTPTTLKASLSASTGMSLSIKPTSMPIETLASSLSALLSSLSAIKVPPIGSLPAVPIPSQVPTSPVTPPAPPAIPAPAPIQTSAATSFASISSSLPSIKTSMSSSLSSIKTSVVTSLPSVSTSLSSIKTSGITSLPSISSLSITTPSPTKSQSSSATSSAALSTNTNCFADNIDGNGRTFKAASTTSSTGMTNEFCESYCGNLGYEYSGTEYSSECYCSTTAPTVKSSQCYMPCSGDPEEICGGPNALLVTHNVTVGTENAAKNAIASSYKSYGCYSDNYPSRVLDGASYTSSSMTISDCAAFCNMNAYSIAGVEYGNECFCGNALLTDGSTYGVGQQAGCTFACSGNSGEICGGANVLNVYSNSPFLPTMNTATDAAPFTAANANGGCASDFAPGNNNVRTLAATSTSSSNMTQELCSSFCSSYRYYGVEYSTQCYCGNMIGSKAVVANNCTDTCAGNSKESCGGGWAMNIFTNTI